MLRGKSPCGCKWATRSRVSAGPTHLTVSIFLLLLLVFSPQVMFQVLMRIFCRCQHSKHFTCFYGLWNLTAHFIKGLSVWVETPLHVNRMAPSPSPCWPLISLHGDLTTFNHDKKNNSAPISMLNPKLLISQREKVVRFRADACRSFFIKP